VRDLPDAQARMTQIGDLDPLDAHRRATARRTRNHRRRIEANGELRQLQIDIAHLKGAVTDLLVRKLDIA
jgi:hypothetical protein